MHDLSDQWDVSHTAILLFSFIFYNNSYRHIPFSEKLYGVSHCACNLLNVSSHERASRCNDDIVSCRCVQLLNPSMVKVVK